MTDDLSIERLDLLSLCAVLRWFDQDLLIELADQPQEAIEILLASDLVTPSAEQGGAPQLRDDVRAEALARLRAERPHREVELRTRAFEYFLGRMRSTEPSAARGADEESSGYYLAELYFLLVERLDWTTLGQHVADMRAAGPQQARHLRQLTFYEGYLAVRTQDYERGEAILMRLLEHADLEDDLRIQALNALGIAAWYQTRFDRALASYRQVLALAGKTGNRFYQGIALINMGMIYNDLDHYDQALDLSIQSLQIFRELGDPLREANALYEIGNNAMRLGRWQLAQQYFSQAISLHETLGLEARLMSLYWAQGFLQHMLGAEAQSEVAHLRALEVARSQNYGMSSVAMDTLSNLGFLYQTQGRWDEALAMYDQSIVVATHLRNQKWSSLIHYRRGNVFERQGRPDAALTAYRQAIATIEVLRVVTEDEEMKIGLLGTTQQLYEAMVRLCLEQDRLDEAFEYVERARSRAFLDALADKSPELYDTLDQPVSTLAEVQAKLPADALLIEYFTIGVLPRGESLIHQLPEKNTRLREHLTLPPQVLIFAVTRERLEVHRPKLDPNTLRPQPGDPSPARRLLRERLLVHLHQHLIAPVGHLIDRRKLLYLIPHGPLHNVPFMALRSATGDHMLQPGGAAIALAPSATILLRNCLSQLRGRASEHYTLGYNDEDGAEPLRYAEPEARHIARLIGGQAWTGPSPKSRRLIAEGRNARWLHIAGHAVYDPHGPLASYLRLGAEDVLSARQIIGELDLAADLVTLNACTSGLTSVVAGDELLGLQRAFLYAGAPAVVCTLWEAADFVALLAMDQFYTKLRRGQAPAAALRDAQLALRTMTGRDLQATIARWRSQDPELIAALDELPAIPPEALDTQIYADPFYWAPFMLVGRPD